MSVIFLSVLGVNFTLIVGIIVGLVNITLYLGSCGGQVLILAVGIA
jgi:hypothetical protein